MGDLTIIVAGGELEAAVRRGLVPRRLGRPGTRAPGARACRGPGLAGRGQRAPGEPVLRVTCAGRGGRRCPGPRGRAGGSGGSPAGPTGALNERAGETPAPPSDRPGRLRPMARIQFVHRLDKAPREGQHPTLSSHLPKPGTARDGGLGWRSARPPMSASPDGAAREGHAPADANVQPAAGPARPSRPQPTVARRPGPTDRPDPNVRQRSCRQPHRGRPDRGDRPRPIQRREVTDHAPGRAGRPSPDRTRPRRGAVQRRGRQPERRHPALHPPFARWA